MYLLFKVAGPVWLNGYLYISQKNVLGMIHHIPESSRFMRKISMRSKKLNELELLRQIEGFTNFLHHLDWLL